MRQVVLIPDKIDGGFTVIVPSLPGCISEGETVEEALANIKEAIELHIESMKAHEEEIPEDSGGAAPGRGSMTRLPVVKPRECVRALQQAGFYIDRQ